MNNNTCPFGHNLEVPILSVGFRPFFLLTILSAIFLPIVWVMMFLNGLPFPGHLLTDRIWHAHEMIFGMTGALMTGFLLTASANWTQTKALHGRALLYLIVLWMLERFMLLLPLPEALSFIGGMLFFPALFFTLFKRLKGHARQFYVFVPLLFLLMLSKFFMLLGAWMQQESWVLLAEQSALHLILFLMVLILGRIVPFFTRMRLPDVNPVVPKFVNLASLIPCALLVIPLPQAEYPLWFQVLFAWALFANALRLGFWFHPKILSIPILYILHIGALWILTYFGLAFMALINESIAFSFIPYHALVVGGLGVTAIGMISRVSLGHSGRPIHADRHILICYGLINLTAIVRVFGALLFPTYIFEVLYISGILWGLCFLLMLIKFAPIYWRPRPDQVSR